MSDRRGKDAGLEATLEQARGLLAQLEDLEPRLGTVSSGDVEMSLLERATELVEEAARLLEDLGRLTA